MRRYLVAAGSFTLLLASATGVAAAHDDGSREPVVVAAGLDNPRQLNWDGSTLLIAEAGQGGDDCVPTPAAEPTGGTPTGDTPAGETATGDTSTVPDPTLPAPDDDGTPDQGSGDAPPPTSPDPALPDPAVPDPARPAPDDDGTPDQGSGDAPLPTSPDPTLADPALPDPALPAPDDDGTPDQGSGDAPAGDTPTGEAPRSYVVPPTGAALPDDRSAADTDGGEPCDGYTGRISTVEHPRRAVDVDAGTAVDRLYSVETADGTIGSDGVAATRFPGVLLIAQGEQTPDALAAPGVESEDPAAETQEHLLVSIDGAVFPWVDLGEAETRLNPDQKPELDSNPNAVIVVDPTPDDEPGTDEYALVADAGANTVWKVTPDFGHLDDNGIPGAAVTVFATFRADDPDAPEFVPSSLAQDEDGNVYVGGVGSLLPGAASVVRYDAGGQETARWDGFTGINGLAVDRDGDHVYVSQILGSAADGNGNVVRVDTDDETWTSVDVPAPSGLALDRHDQVFVSANSTSPAVVDGDPQAGGRVLRFSFPHDVAEQPLPVTAVPDLPEPTVPDPTVPDPAVPAPDDDGTPDQGSGDVPLPDPTVPALDDDGTPDQGSGEVPSSPGPTAPDPTVPAPGDDGTPDQGSGDIPL
jgi:hypothetical protein